LIGLAIYLVISAFLKLRGERKAPPEAEIPALT
jgi:hypothetical protein